MPFSHNKSRRLRNIFLVYWILLGYILVALIWWFIALINQNHQMANYKISELNLNYSGYHAALEKITNVEKRKTAQYIGEGAVFFLLIITGAVYIYRVVKSQFKISRQQQNFMMAITHELKTPIAITKLNLETLQKRKLEEAQQQRLLQNTIQEANRLNALCNNMLLYSQIEESGYKIVKEQINLSAFITECINEFQTRFPQRQYTAVIEPGLHIQGDLLLIQMAINNLIDNATKYTPKNLPVALLLFKADANIIFQIKDEGKGIANEEKKKIFDKFYRIGNTATKEAKGTGLGLYLTKKIVQQHKAHISVTDNTPVGSIFTIIFKE